MLPVYTGEFACKVQAIMVDGQWKVGCDLVFLIVTLIDVTLLKVTLFDVFLLLYLITHLSLIILSQGVASSTSLLWNVSFSNTVMQ